MRLVSLATAVPERSWTQPECWSELKNSLAVKELKPRSLELLEKVLLGNSGIDTRHFAAVRLADIFDRNAQGLNETYEVAYLITETDPENIAVALNKLLNDGLLYERLSENCTPAREQFNWQKEEKSLLAFYQHILE